LYTNGRRALTLNSPTRLDKMVKFQALTLGKKIYPKLAFVIGIACSLALMSFFYSRHRLEQQFKSEKQKLIKEDFLPMTEKINHFFETIYKSNRTISLLPSVRNIKDGNRSSDAEDILKEKRFSEEAHLSVQQLYNNLASSVSVSEIYALHKNFHPEKGEIPFFMYDQLIIGKGQEDNSNEENPSPEESITQEKTESGSSSTPTSDIPEESEEAEYRYFPFQIEHFNTPYQTLSLRDLDEIPSHSSPVLRTCDNSQYLSISSGDSSNALGIFYSTPIYDLNHKFLGIITTVFRTNVLEAHLLGMPYLIITKEDEQSARRENISYPDELGNFVLVQAQQNTYIGDRRNASLLESIKNLGRADSITDQIYSTTLPIRDDNPWRLYYQYSPQALKVVENQENRFLFLMLTCIAVLSLLSFVGIVYVENKNQQLRNLAQKLDEAEKQGDLTVKLTLNRKDEVGELARLFERFTEKMHKIMKLITSHTQTLVRSSTDLGRVSSEISLSSKSSGDLASRVLDSSETFSKNIHILASSSEEMSSSIKDVAHSVKEMNSSLAEVSKSCMRECENTQTASRQTEEASKTLRDLNLASREIGKIVDLISSISNRTSLLALNASIEAASAGPAGKGFAVVANEVKELSRQTAQATEQIRSQVEGINNFTQKSAQSVDGVNKIIEDINQIAQTIAAAVEQQSATMGDIAQNFENVSLSAADVTKNISEFALGLNGIVESMQKVKTSSDLSTHGVLDINQNIQNLEKLSGELDTVVSQFKL